MATESDGSGDVDEAARAFEDLRTEIASMRQMLEALRPALEQGRGPDYSPTLGVIAKNLHAATVRIDAIAKHTGANLAPEIARREIARAYDEALRPARLDLERATREVLDAVHVLYTAAAKGRVVRAQRAWLLGAGSISFAAGLLAFPILVHPLARLLPASWAVPQAISKSVLGR